MGKRGKSEKKGDANPSKRKLRDEHNRAVEDDMDDEIDAFHKQRDIVPLDINEDAGESDEDSEQPVFDFQNIDEEDDEDYVNDAPRDTGLAAKIVRQQNFMNAKFGRVEDDLLNDEEETEQNTVLGRGKYQYYDADNRDFEIQSDDDKSAEEEEVEVLRLQRERAKLSTLDDYGFPEVCEDESDRELTFKEISVNGESKKKSLVGIDVADDMGTANEEVKKDLNALSEEEKMDFLYNSAPELVEFFLELNATLEELESRVNPFLSKVKKGEVKLEGGMRYLEVKQILLLAYCQAITFYLLLKSEGQPAHDHPVLARIVEIKSLLDKMKQLDENLPSGFEEILNKCNGVDELMHSGKDNVAEASDSFAEGNRSPVLLGAKEVPVSLGIAELEKAESLKVKETEAGKRKYRNGVVGVQSIKMLKVRADLEEKLKLKGVFSSITPKTDKPRKLLKPLNGKLESYDDFGDDTVNVEGANEGITNGRASKLAQLVAANRNKSKIVSGDDDLPRRDDIGERRRKHELQVLAGAGIKSEDDAGNQIGIISDDGDVEMEDIVETGDSEDELYEQVKKDRAAKLAAKAQMYSGPSKVPSLVEIEPIEGKRHITYQMEKNRGLTRPRKKEIKNPRKKYKLKHQKAVERRKGQVREVKKPTGPYGGEASGINAGISRSIRFKN